MDYAGLNSFTPNLFRGQRAMMHIPESSSGEAFHPLFVIVHSCKQSLLRICHIHGSSVAIFFIITRILEVKLQKEKIVYIHLLQKVKQCSC